MFYVNGQLTRLLDFRREAEENRNFDEAHLIRRERGEGISLPRRLQEWAGWLRRSICAAAALRTASGRTGKMHARPAFRSR